MKKALWLIPIAALFCAIVSVGCNKEPEVGYGGEVQTAPGGKAPTKPGGGGMKPSLE